MYVEEVGIDGDPELDSTPDVTDGADSLVEVLEGNEVSEEGAENSGDVRNRDDWGDDSVNELRV
jgi:hypothetical protein